MVAMFDHDVDIRALGNHVYMIHMMHMWTHMRVRIIVTQREPMLRQLLATVAAKRGCDWHSKN